MVLSLCRPTFFSIHVRLTSKVSALEFGRGTSPSRGCGKGCAHNITGVQVGVPK